MKGHSAGIALLVILTLASPTLAGGPQDEAQDLAQQTADDGREAARSAWDDNMAEDGPADEAWDTLWDHVPENVRDPRDVVPVPGEEDEEPTEDDTSDPVPIPVDGSPAGIIGGLQAMLEDTADEAGDAPAYAAAFFQDLFRVGNDVVIFTIGAVDRVTGPAVEQTVAYAVATYEDVQGLVDQLAPAGDETASRDGKATAPTVAAIDSAIVGPNHQIAVLALVAASGLGAAMLGFAFLRRLLSLGGLAMLSRINSKDIMKNETRASVHEIVKSDPGVSLNEIVERLGVSRNAVAYHLAVFESEDQIVSVKDGKYRRYFVNGGRFVNGAKHVVSALKNDTTRQVIEYINGHPGAIQKDVCAAVGTSPSATNWHINRLEKVGLVNKQKVANTVQYTPGPSFQKYELDEFGLVHA